MKKLVLLFLAAVGGLTAASAQTFSMQKDSVKTSLSGGFEKIHNDITNLTSSPIKITWRITATDFPSSWNTPSAAGLCDNKSCTPGIATGMSYTSSDIDPNGVMTFYVGMDMDQLTENGTHYFTVNVADAGAPGNSKDATFVVTKFPTGIKSISRSDDAVTIYPNPARTELNVIYNEKMDVKNIAVYNMIGRVVGVYKATDTKSAKLNVENMPSGAYFVRLIDSKGRVAAIRKFTHL
jgi:Secretion system C-terminal sorting domain